MAEAAAFIKKMFNSEQKILCHMEGPLNSDLTDSIECMSWDTAGGMTRTLTDQEVCDTNEDLYYFTIGRAILINGDDVSQVSK